MRTAQKSCSHSSAKFGEVFDQCARSSPAREGPDLSTSGPQWNPVHRGDRVCVRSNRGDRRRNIIIEGSDMAATQGALLGRLVFCRA